MTAFLIRRIAFALVTLFAVLTLVFVIVRILPGDPAYIILGDQATRDSIEAMHVRLGLDQPILVQYASFLGNALRGDWGVSMVTGQPVLAEVLNVLPWTIELTLVSLALGIALGVPLGVWAAVRRNRLVDYVVRIASLAGLSFPAFVSAIILLFLFAIELRWFPVISAHKGSLRAWTQSITLPAISLGLNSAAYITRVTRSAMLEVLPEDYVRTARAKGSPERIVVWRHAFLSVSFRTDGVWRPAVEALSFDVGPRETVALVGESGSGKSVTALSVMRLLPPANSKVEGAIRLDGRDVLKLPEREMRSLRGAAASMIFQEPMTSLNPVLTVGFQIAEALTNHRELNRKAAEAETLRILERVRVPAAR